MINKITVTLLKMINELLFYYKGQTVNGTRIKLTLD